MKRIAVVGGGISGLGAAWRLAGAQDEVAVTLFEADGRAGGHANTLDVTLPGADGKPITHGVDTGFLVFNERTYPQLIRLFDELKVPTAPSDMSFSVQVPGALEWCGSSLATVFAQRRNLVSGPFWRMLGDILRFNRLCTSLAMHGQEAALRESIGDFLNRHGFSPLFREGYLLPMVACIWSCPVQQMMAFPIATLIRFCHNHGLLQVTRRPQWFTVRGGSREYVRRMVRDLPDVRLHNPVHSVVPLGLAGEAGVMVHSRMGAERFDAVVLACHSDQALGMLGAGALPQERAVLGAIRYQSNEAILHTDERLLPERRSAWAAWNYERAANASDEDRSVCLHYLLNRLQPLPWQQPVIVSLNAVRPPQATQVLARLDYAHPVFDQAAIDAQRELPMIQGRRGLWFAGAWTGYGFHEDGLCSGLWAADALMARWRHADDPPSVSNVGVLPERGLRVPA